MNKNSKKSWQAAAVMAIVALAAACGRGEQPKAERPQAAQGSAESNKGMAGTEIAGDMKGMPGMAMAGGGIAVDPAKQQLIGMRIAEATYQPLDKTIRTVGRVEYDERKLKQISAKTEGWIERLYVDFTGQLVRRGDPLFTVYSPELVSTQEEYLLALQAKKQTSSSPFHHVAAAGNSLLEATRRRLLLWDITPEQIAELERNGRPTKTLTLASPIDGFVIEKTALEGMRVEPSMVLYKIADLSTVWVYADIYEYELPLVRVGQQATVRLSYDPGRTFQGRVVYVYPYLDSKTRTAKIRFELPNTGDRRLKPGMFADVELKVQLGRRLAVPREAVLDSGTRQIVFVEKGDGHFEPKEVTLGMRVDGQQEILSGLKPGARVVASANFFLDSESKLRESMGLMAAMPGMERMRMPGMEGMEGMPGMEKGAKAPAGPQEKTVAGITLAFSTVPTPAKVGDNLLRVRLTDSKGETIRNAKVSFSFTMPMPGMTDVGAQAAFSKEGFYEAKANLGMGGTWHVTVKVVVPGKPEIKQRFAVAAGGEQ
ncbi:MAG: efflux RND transporter periplasmic adaptor subunit [candidate division NC10 bacterium]|nr:efflux RND transporter periplasmic adaptor subunit [candidate division NC10 bacterium]